ncbi:MAG: ATP-binding protein [Vicinamibacterales bacterium]
MMEKPVKAGSAQGSWSRWWRPGLPLLVVSVLLYLGVANIYERATFRDVEDGALWEQGPQGVSAAAIAAGTPAEQVGLRPGDVLVAIDDQPIERIDDVLAALQSAAPGQSLRYTVLRLGTRDVLDVRIGPVPSGSAALYFLLASVGIFTLLVGAAVRLRRARDQASLHFFWLAVAFFGVFTFSFSGRLDRLDWVFYWGDIVSLLALPPLFVHFTLVFPERPRGGLGRRLGRLFAALLYVPAVCLGLAYVLALSRAGATAGALVEIVDALDRASLLHFGAYLVGGIAVLFRALAEVRSLTARRQLRWIVWGTALGVVPFATAYAVPFALGVEPSLPLALSAVPLSLVPLAYASAIVRYRLMDVEVIVKRALVYALALAAIVAIYALLLRGVEQVFVRGDAANNWVIALLATLVALLLAPPMKEAIQNGLDRMFYRDRYDYRRALIGFARDLNSDLDLNRLSERLVSMVVETLMVDKMALMLEDEAAPHFGSVRASGFGDRHPPALAKRSGIGARLAAGHMVLLDDPIAVSRFALSEIDHWRDVGLSHFIPCVVTEGTIAVLALGRKTSGEPLNSDDIGLLAAVAGQIATALENARLYRQLHLKALELDRMRTFNENILESLDDGLLVLDLDDRIVRWNLALERMYGAARTDVIDRRVDDVFTPQFVEAIRTARRDAPDGTTLSRLPVNVGESARTLVVNAAVIPLRAAEKDGAVTSGTIVILEDITARVQLEEQLQISEKMASIGLLAAGVAHEVNTPLTGISSFTQMLLEGADPGDPKTRLLEKIEVQTFRAAKIVNGLLNLSRPGASGGDRAPVDLNGVITDVLSLLEHQFEVQRIRVRRELAGEPVVVMGYEHKMQQVFLNLFLNARDSMSSGGWLSITTSLVDGLVQVEVSDTGSGIPSEYLARIYDPFFTTKEIGKGTGLGLSITYGIVREHEGAIDCDSVMGQGTRFTLKFPVATAAADRPSRVVHN